MILAFLDESARKTRYYYMGALMVGSVEATALENSLDNIAEMVAKKVRGFDPATEFHGYEVFHGEGAWANVPVPLLTRVCRLVSKVIYESGATFVFRGIDVDALNAKYSDPHPPHTLALAHALESVQRVLTADHPDEKALILADDHHTAPDSRTRFRGLRANAVNGFTSVPLDGLIDTIYFGPSHHSRLLQAADMATFFTNRFKTIKETHPEAQKAMRYIKRNLNKTTRFSYVWSP